MKRAVEYQDLLKFYFPAAPALSPDGEMVAYRLSRAAVSPDEPREVQKKGYHTNIWLYDLKTNANRPLTSFNCEDFFCWSRDGTEIIFASRADMTGDSGGPKNEKKEKEDKKESRITRFYKVPVRAQDGNGGGVMPLFTVPCAATAVRALDEKRYLITAVFEPEYKNENPEGADIMIFDQVPFMANGKGYTGQSRTGLGVYDVTAGTFTRLTPPDMDVGHVSLNTDRTLAFLTAVEYGHGDVRPLNNGVYRLDLASGRCELLSDGLSFTFGCAVQENDGSIIVTATDHKARGVNENPKVWRLDEEGGMTCLTPELDVSLGHSLVSDTAYGCVNHEGAVTPGPQGLLCCVVKGFKARLCVLAGGETRTLRTLTPVVSSVIDYSDYAAPENSPSGAGRIAYIAYEGMHLPELYLYENGQERRLTSFNDEFFNEHDFSQPIHIVFKGQGGVPVDGWYMRPMRGGERCPAILNIHGGPKAAFGDIYHHEMQCWAAKGYAVIYCNPRGSDGRGDGFSDIRGRYGEIDYRDLMDFTDWCVKNLKFIDASRLGVTGGSYGGYMTNWIITQTNRFSAAVSQRGIANWVSKFGGCDIGYYYVEDQHRGTPWKNSGGPWKDSPVSRADRAATPTLFVHSDEDFRCELNQGFQMFTALKVNGVETRLCVFRGENHELSRSGKPKNRLARLRVIAEWFDKYLRGAR